MSPKPFQRPSIDLSRPARVWKLVRAENLYAGDTIAYFGTIAQRTTLDNGGVRFTNAVTDETLIYPPDEVLKAFVPPTVDGQSL